MVVREMEFAPVATSRFCGLCPQTHATASSEAIERSISCHQTRGYCYVSFVKVDAFVSGSPPTPPDGL